MIRNEVIITDSSKCRQCYSCVRNCPVKAVKIENGKAQIIQSRCIQCGNCIKNCPRDAKRILDSKEYVKELLKKKTIAILAPSFCVSFNTKKLKDTIEDIKKLGFYQVWETAIGAEYVFDFVEKYLKINSEEMTLSSACPAFVSLIEKHYPKLISKIAPVCSPMIATGRIIRKIHDDISIVFIGPCVAKKMEIQEVQFSDCIDAVLTFKELKELIKDNKNKEKTNDGFKYYIANEGRIIPLSGGINSNIGSIPENKLLVSEGTENCVELVKYLASSQSKKDFIFCDTLMCKGCIDGPGIDNDLSFYEKRRILLNFIEEREEIAYTASLSQKYDIDMSRSFENKENAYSVPTEEEIKEILYKTNKYTPSDELNCGACGYATCREKAIAVYQGIAEVEMCIPYLLEKKNELYSELLDKYKTITYLNDQMSAIFESSFDGMIVCDNKGKIINANKAYKKMINLNTLPENIKELEQEKIIFPSATILALKEKRRITFLQEVSNGKIYVATGSPIINNAGEILGVVTNIRDIEELNKFRKTYNEEKNICTIDGYTGVVVNSDEFTKVITTASKAAKYMSTVLLLGETGVGKDVVAGLIHYLSNAKEGLFIKVNCGAIPENLLEAELFGYEAGAFTGASRDGKKGSFEMAHKGTIFLNEVGDLPLAMQVKLLQVLQDKKIKRIGGNKYIDADVRIIAATNKDLELMIKEGTFRNDLYYRLNVIPIKIPPLRERKSDIMPLAYHYLQVFNQEYNTSKDFSVDVENVLVQYFWPGNVRELRNVIERIFVTSSYSVITTEDFPAYIFGSDGKPNAQVVVNSILPLKEAKDEVERIIINQAYKLYGNTYKVAEILGVNQSTIVRKINKLNLK